MRNSEYYLISIKKIIGIMNKKAISIVMNLSIEVRDNINRAARIELQMNYKHYVTC